MIDDDRPGLTVRRSLAAVAGGLASGCLAAVIAALVVGAATSGATTTGEGIGAAVLAAAGGVFLGCLVSALVVLLTVRGRRRGARFSGMFSTGLALLLVFFGVGVVGSVAAPLIELVGLGPLLWLLVPPLWSIPAAAAGVVRLRWVGYVLALGLGAVLLTLAVGELGASRDQARFDAAWTGPVLVPSTSPASPLAGYVLRGVTPPGEYADLAYSYVSPGDEGVQADASVAGDRPAAYYDLRFVAPEDVATYAPCGTAAPVCPVVGRALGGDVLADASSGSWVVLLDDGAVTLTGSFDDDDAVSVLDDLRPAGLDAVHDLRVDPDVAL